MLKPDHYLVILCGGTGPRLWPLSRISHPKQFLKIFNDKSLIENTLERCQKITDAKHIFITTTKNLSKKIKYSNLLVEPTKQNTTTAALLALTKINQLNKSAIITIMPSDQYIGEISKFEKCLKNAYELATNGKFALIGIKPSFPNVSYGYISSKSSRFIEKPNVLKAQRLIENKYYWNTDINTFSISTFLSELKLHSPDYLKKSLKQLYVKSPNLNIAHSILEKSKILSLVKGDFTWNDVGEWKTIYQQLPKDINEHVNFKNSKFLSINSQKCLIAGQANKLVGLVGVKNLAIVDTPDALLICNIANVKDSYEVRTLVAKIMKSNKLRNFFTKNLNDK